MTEPTVVGQIVGWVMFTIVFLGVGFIAALFIVNMLFEKMKEDAKRSLIITITVVIAILLDILLYRQNQRFENAPEWQKQRWREQMSDPDDVYPPDEFYPRP